MMFSTRQICSAVRPSHSLKKSRSSAGPGRPKYECASVKVVLAYVVTGLPLFVFALAVVVLANLLRSGTAVFFLSVLLYLVFHFLGIVFSRYASFFVTSSFDWYTLWIADAVNWGKILRQLLILLGCGMMLFTAGYYLFERKDL